MSIIQSGDFEPEKLIKQLHEKDDRTGAVAVFIGAAKNMSKGKQITRLEFECYPGMAQKTLDDLEREAKAKFGVLNCHIIHRTGGIPVGGNIVFIGVSSVNRADAFDACEWLIDELKKRAPIWKKEFTKDGSRWVEEHP